MQVTSVANGLARGSRQYMRNRRNEIFGLFSQYGAPKFFITINPDDARHPLALVMGVEKPDGEREVAVAIERETFYSYRQGRLKVIAEDPVRQARFFDKIMRTVVEVVFGFRNEGNLGVLGQVAAYYFIIEAQGKGTLHAHGLIWLTDCTSSVHFFLRLTDTLKSDNAGPVAGKTERPAVQKSSY
jgi:Helitron helicase-like domain at N-terminus